MSTIEDFENAPFGATATQEETRARAVRLHREFGETWVVAEADGTFDTFESEELVDGGFTLDPPAPTTAREALALAWELAHPVKEGQVIPADTDTISISDESLYMHSEGWDHQVEPGEVGFRRTLDPLPEPDWLDAPAVLAHLDNPIFQQKSVFTPTSAKPDCWTQAGTALTFHWSKLRDVTPLWPKEDA